MFPHVSSSHLIPKSPRAKDALEVWQAAFGSSAAIGDTPAGTCFAKVAVAYDGQRSPLVNDASFPDCTVSRTIVCFVAPGHLLAPSPRTQPSTLLLFIG
jgi:hypothetical protein